MKSTASSIELILSASLSGISNPNSSSRAITTSTVSKLSNPRSFWKWAVDGSTFWKFLTQVTTRSVTSDLSRNDPRTSSEKWRRNS
ncbi:hypothetical protein HanPSC8_Chr16g0716671 [Helianthus annuus]|nr:hypothetical protein HanPSC8_Chr16g0716671 [Helianthus annuus]